MKRQRKLFTRPFKRWDKTRLKEESHLSKDYGLKNKRELWKAKDTIRKFRSRAKRLFTEETGRDELFSKLKKLGIFKEDSTLDDVLGLRVEDILERRLQTLVLRKGLAETPGQARQLITHRHISIGGNVMDIPGHIVNVEEEKTISYSKRSALNDKDHPLRATPKAEKEENKKVKEESKGTKETKKDSEKVKEGNKETKKEIKEVKKETKNSKGVKENKIDAKENTETPKKVEKNEPKEAVKKGGEKAETKKEEKK